MRPKQFARTENAARIILMERTVRVECNKCPDAIRFSVFFALGISDVSPAEFNQRACEQLESYGWTQQPNHAWLCPVCQNRLALAGGQFDTEVSSL